MIDALDPRFVPATSLAKGRYAILTARNPFRHLIYRCLFPGPGRASHVGFVRYRPLRSRCGVAAGHDPRRSITLSGESAGPVAPVIAGYWPKVTAAMLAPGYSGVRPKAGGGKTPMPISASKVRLRMALKD